MLQAKTISKDEVSCNHSCPLGVQVDSNGTVAGGLKNPKNHGPTRQKLAHLRNRPQSGTPGLQGPQAPQLAEKNCPHGSFCTPAPNVAHIFEAGQLARENDQGGLISEGYPEIWVYFFQFFS